MAVKTERGQAIVCDLPCASAAFGAAFVRQ